jgi:LppP/LprE lipoprotein
MASPLQARRRRLALAPLASAAAVVWIAGCGGGAKTVSVSSTPTVSQSPDTTGSTAALPAGTSRRGATTGPAGAQTRTAPEPAFAEGQQGSGSAGAGAEGLDAALAVVRAHGFLAENTATYHPNQTLRVLIGVGGSSKSGQDRQAFFFLGGRYVGTDASSPSAQVSVVSQGDTEVTLAYALYRPGDQPCCPGGGQAKVRFQLNNGQLMALEPIPPVSSSTGPSRR